MATHCIPEPGKICDNPATFSVWISGAPYFMCKKHASEALLFGVNGYEVAKIEVLNANSEFPVPVSSRPKQESHKATVIKNSISNDYLVISTCPRCDTRFASPCDKIEALLYKEPKS